MIISRPWRYLLFASVTLGLLALKGWCEIGLPFPPADDAFRILPQIVQAREDGRAINPICADISGNWLFTHLTAALMPQANYPSLALVLFGYQAVTLLALTLVVARAPAHDLPTTGALVAALLTAAAWLSFERPESLAQMWGALGLLAFTHTRGGRRQIMVIATMLLVFATSGLAGILLSLVYGAYRFFQSPPPALIIGPAIALNLLGFALVALIPLAESSALRLYTDRGLDRAEATFLLNQIMDEEPGRIDFTPALFTLTTHPRGICLTAGDFLPDGSIRSRAELVLVQQIRPHKDLPPEFRNYTLIRNYFCSYRPGYGPFRFAESPRVYNFAVYRRIDFTTK